MDWRAKNWVMPDWISKNWKKYIITNFAKPKPKSAFKKGTDFAKPNPKGASTVRQWHNSTVTQFESATIRQWNFFKKSNHGNHGFRKMC